MRNPLLLFIVILVVAGIACGTTTVSVETGESVDSGMLPTLVPTAEQPAEPEPDTPRNADGSGLPPTFTPAPTLAVPTVAPPSTPTATIDPGSLDVYVVVAGDTLREIAESYGVSVEELAALNGITNIDVIEVGQRLLIPPQ